MYGDASLEIGGEYTFDYIIKQIKERIALYRQASFEDSDPVYYANYQNYISTIREKINSVASNNNLVRNNAVFESANQFYKRDAISHTMIRFACQNDYEKTFIDKEAKIFYLRLQDMITDGRLDQSESSFVEKVADVKGTQRISPDEFQTIRKDLAAALKQDPDRLRLNAFMKVKFLTVPKVVASRRCIIRDGWVYCSVNEYKIYIVDEFKREIVRSISLDKNLVNYMRERNLGFSSSHKELFDYIRKELVGLSNDSSRFNELELRKLGMINLTTLYDMMNASKVPPCIKNMYDSMKTSGHLKHMGRFMFGSFLKTLGVDHNTADQFIRAEFSRSNVNSADFDKKYRYYFRHIYGLEGAKKDYTAPQACGFYVANQPASPEQVHGCPFKSMESTRLRQFLKKHYITSDSYNYILNDVVNNRSDHVQACATTFNYSHFAIKTDDVNREVAAHFRKDEVSTFPVRFAIKAMEVSNMKVNSKIHYNAYKQFNKKDVEEKEKETDIGSNNLNGSLADVTLNQSKIN